MKMIRTSQIVVYMLLLSGSFQVHSIFSEHCVVSDDNQSNSTCHTLKYYMRNSSLYFKSDSTFNFLYGEHFTDFNVSLQVSNVSRLTLEGNGATIQCNQRNNFFHFSQVHGLVVKNLNFSQCGILPADETHRKATLQLTDVKDFEVTSIAISRSIYQGIVLDDSVGIIANSTIEYCQSIDMQPANAMYFTNCADYNSSYNMLIKNTLFLRNKNTASQKNNFYLGLYPYAAGLTVVIECPNTAVILDNITTDGNIGNCGGNLAFILQTPNLYAVKPIVVKNSHVKNGVADQGGGIFVSLVQPFSHRRHNNLTNHQILLIDNTIFENNSALFLGGAISIRQKESNVSSYIGDITIKDSTFAFNSFKNEEEHGGSAITSINFILTEVDQHISPQFKTFILNCLFYENFIVKNKHMSTGTAVIFVKTNPHFSFSDVRIYSSNSSGILGLQSNLVLGGTIIISNNMAQRGGGILLCQNAVLYLESGLDLLISNNTANFTGGGIAVESVCVVSMPICFFQLASSSPQDLNDISIHLHNNSAGEAGYNLYGGSVDYCYMIENSVHNVSANHSLPVFRKIFDIYPNYSAGSPYVTSPPIHVCTCINNSAACDIKEYYHPTAVYSGQAFSISIVLAGQLNGSTPGYVKARLEHSSQMSLSKNSRVQNISQSECSTIEYTIYSHNVSINAIMKVSAAEHKDNSVIQYLPQYRQLRVIVSISDCPKGFSVSNSKKVCDCEPVLTAASVLCNITSQTIVVQHGIWIGYVNNSNTSTMVTSNHCPLDYCINRPSHIHTSLTYFDQDSQCVFNRTGIMCGRCKDGYSVMFGGKHCTKCSNDWLWLLFLYAIVGILLVLGLTVLNITVSDGTINGLIFYANVVQACHPSLFTNQMQDNLFSRTLDVFIGGLSLQNEVESCFYNGMTEYSKAWIEFVFPFYIWIVLGLIVLFSRRCRFVNSLIPKNTVKVFATLILLSYCRLLQSVIIAMNFTRLYISTQHYLLVWTEDGNIPLFSKYHLPLFIFSLCLLVLLVPFTISLLFIQIFERYSHYRVFWLVNKFKPLLDAYTGPYTDSARFWTGLLLLFRVVVCICSALIDQYISVAVALLFVLLSIGFSLPSGIYQEKKIQFLEGSLLLNLALLLMITNYHTVDQTYVTNVFVGIAFVTLLVSVLVYHVAKKVFSINFVQAFLLKTKSKLMQRNGYQRIEPQNVSDGREDSSVVQFREPLLDVAET